ncbi:exopolysaccharide biosynthesis polyprenyl glycosylphosphotransferase [Blastopirellula marina]|uniref:Undecaprenyl-phosphate galactose phosphotransferase WbaP n=1 Tax=Blastopirellula marina TaxID=124 RepID=A0A2S8GHS0_9BACT|nr:exopolysaccharide biosynthesis polyprenyl glycosylphosphotransferase [Blastopirellula marina]PQO43890.1 undecaprenyl-phosphate galactose phosphotransferase WbaP [Blastopirellula marina]
MNVESASAVCAESDLSQFDSHSHVGKRWIGLASAAGSRLSGGERANEARRLSDLSFSQMLLFGTTLATADFVAMLAVVLFASMGVSLVGVPAQDGLAITLAWFIPVVLIPIARLAGLYPAMGMSAIVEFRQLARALALALAAGPLVAFVAASWGGLIYGTIVSAVALLMALPTLPASRFFVRSVLSRFNWWTAPVLICSDPKSALRLCRQLQSMPERGLKPVGILLLPGEKWDWNVESCELPVYDLQDASSCAVRHSATWVLVQQERGALDIREADALIAHSLWAIPNRILLSSASLELGMWDETHTVGPAGGLRFRGSCPNTFRRSLKRVFDVLFATAALTISFPFCLFAAIAIKLSSPGPIFYGQKRVGRFGKEFTAWKFRTMRQNADQVLNQYLESDPALKAEWEETHKLKRDPRITSIGGLLRKTSLDELPQLWNILVGDMSAVGPRPIVDSPTYDRDYMVAYPQEFAAYKSVRPGLTGMWQITCRNSGRYEMRIYWDMYYIRNWSLWLDVYIVLRTVRTVLLREGAY